METTELKDATQRLMEDLRQVVRDGEDVLRAGAGELSQRSAGAREQLAEAIQSARQMLGQLQQKTIEGAKATDKVVREHPYQAMGIAFGVGLLLGLLIRRR